MRTICLPMMMTMGVAAAAGAGCEVPTDLAAPAPALGAAEQPIGGCPFMACTNSPELLYRGVHELNLRGQFNGQDLTIRTANGRAQIYKGKHAYDLSVEQSRFVGRRPGYTPLTGNALVGAEIHLVQSGATAYIIDIYARRQIAYPYGPAGTLDAYHLTWRTPGQAPTPDQHVCNELLWVEDVKQKWPTLLGMESEEVVVFEGDRIHRETLAMSGPGQSESDWFNLGCAGRALAKLHLTRNTAASLAEPDSWKAWRQRQSTLRMLAADYCGIGKPFTFSGAKLAWQVGYVGYLNEPAGIEARWDTWGARCLDTPRLAGDALAESVFGPLPEAIYEACGPLPACEDANPRALDGAAAVSAVY